MQCKTLQFLEFDVYLQKILQGIVDILSDTLYLASKTCKIYFLQATHMYTCTHTVYKSEDVYIFQKTAVLLYYL